MNLSAVFFYAIRAKSVIIRYIIDHDQMTIHPEFGFKMIFNEIIACFSSIAHGLNRFICNRDLYCFLTPVALNNLLNYNPTEFRLNSCSVTKHGV